MPDDLEELFHQGRKVMLESWHLRNALADLVATSQFTREAASSLRAGDSIDAADKT